MLSAVQFGKKIGYNIKKVLDAAAFRNNDVKINDTILAKQNIAYVLSLCYFTTTLSYYLKNNLLETRIF